MRVAIVLILLSLLAAACESFFISLMDKEWGVGLFPMFFILALVVLSAFAVNRRE